MTDRHAAYIVTLDHCIREDDADAILTALRMVRAMASTQRGLMAMIGCPIASPTGG